MKREYKKKYKKIYKKIEYLHELKPRDEHICTLNLITQATKSIKIRHIKAILHNESYFKRQRNSKSSYDIPMKYIYLSYNKKTILHNENYFKCQRNSKSPYDIPMKKIYDKYNKKAKNQCDIIRDRLEIQKKNSRLDKKIKIIEPLEINGAMFPLIDSSPRWERIWTTSLIMIYRIEKMLSNVETGISINIICDILDDIFIGDITDIILKFTYTQPIVYKFVSPNSIASAIRSSTPS